MILERVFKVMHVLEVGTLVGLFLYFSYGAYVNYQDVPLQKTDKETIDAVNEQLTENKDNISSAIPYSDLTQLLREYKFTRQYPTQKKSDYYLYSCSDKQIVTEIEYYNRWDYTSAKDISYSQSTIDFITGQYQPKIQLRYPTWSKDYYPLFPQYHLKDLTAQLGNPEIQIDASPLEKEIIEDALTSAVFYNGKFFHYLPEDGKYIYTETVPDQLWLDKTLWVLDNVKTLPSHFVEGSLITKVILNNRIVTIPDSAFKDCIYLEDIQFSDSLVRIERNAFENCISLYDLDFPKTLQTLEKDSFKDCISLMRIYLPLSLTDCDPEALSGFGKTMVINTEGTAEQYRQTVFADIFKNLENRVFYPNDNPYLGGWTLSKRNDEDLTFVYYDTIGVNANIWLGAKTTSNEKQYLNQEIQRNCCENVTSILRIYIQPGITTVKDRAFYHTSAQYIYIPASVTSLGKDAFGYSYRLHLFEVEATSSHFASVDGALYALDADTATLLVFPSAFSGDYTVPEKFEWNDQMVQVTHISNHAFDHCYNLKNLTIPQSIRYSIALRDCPNTIIIKK